ncbi:MAG: FKBP-type peptidyl-prolyl cis-trans isomerase [Gammaproteobacteria bacterium]
MNFPRILSLRSAVLAVSLTAMSAQAADSAVDLTSQDNQISYSIGVNIGQNLAGQGIMGAINLDAFFEGIRDVVTGEPQLTQDEMMAALEAFQTQLMEQQAIEIAAIQAESEAFLAANAQEDGVMTTDSGLQYTIIETGDASGVSPTLNDSVLAHYHGTFIDGEVFDSSVDRGEPAEFGVGQVIAGWTEALQMMKPGDKWRLFIPSNLAYGETGSGPIGPFTALIFDVELLQVNTQ